MKYCARCGQETSDEAGFCQSCGYAFSKLQNALKAEQPYGDSNINIGTHQNQDKAEGWPVISQETQPEITTSYNEPLTSSKTKGFNKKLKILICSVLALLLVAAGGFWGWQKYGTEARAQGKLELGIKYLSENDYEKAVLAFDEAIKIDPKEVKAYQGLAKIFTLQGKYDEAKAAYERGTAAVKPEYQIVLRLSLAGMFIDKGDLSQAEAFFQQIINGNKACVDAYIGLAMVYQQQGNKDKALAILEQCVKENSQDYRAYNALARYYTDSCDMEKTMQNVVKSLDLEVNQQEAYMILDDLYKGKWADLTTKSDKVAGPKTAAMLKFYASYSEQKYSQALSDYYGSLATDTNNLKARVLAAVCLVKNGRQSEAEKIIDGLPKDLNTWIMADVAQYYKSVGDYKNSVSWAQKSLNKEPRNYASLIILVDISKMDSQTEAAQVYLTRLVVLGAQPVTRTKSELISRAIDSPSFLIPFDINKKQDSVAGNTPAIKSQASDESGGRLPFCEKDCYILGVKINSRPDEAIGILGPPITKENGHWTYSFGWLEVMEFENRVREIYIETEGVSGPRGIVVGDSIESVINKFPNENHPIRDDGIKNLYTDRSTCSSGYIYYDDTSRARNIYFMVGRMDGKYEKPIGHLCLELKQDRVSRIILTDGYSLD